MKTAKADYSYQIIDDVLAIEDLNNGNMSVTNDIEAVVHDIEEEEQIHAKDMKIVYKDSEGVWDGVELNGSTVQFLALCVLTLPEAIELMK